MTVAAHKLDNAENAKVRRMVELARSHVESGWLGAANVYYRMIINETSPPKDGLGRLARGEACVWYARRALSIGNVGEAADWYRKAVQADPLAVDYRIEYCIKALLPMASHKLAKNELEVAVKIEPDNIEAWRKLGGVHHILGNSDASLAAYHRAFMMAPDDPHVRTDMATIALDLADYETVREMCDPCLGGPLRGDALHLLAMVAHRESNHEKAVELFNGAIAAGCHEPELVRWHSSLSMHAIGRYRDGWLAHEARGRQGSDRIMAAMMNRFTAPRWTGQPAPARIHLHQEMGLGDTLAMVRYVSLMIERGYQVCLEVDDGMVSLMTRSFPQAEVIPKAIDYPGAMGVPPFDYHVPMLSLPTIFKTEVETVPWSGPYLRPDTSLVERYLEKLPGMRSRIGLCWSAGVREGVWLSEYGRRKSMPFAALSKIIDRADRFVSLQVGPERVEGRDMCVDVLPDKPTWDDTAALIECVDLVITVDTSVAHMAGALGKPVWVMCQRDGQSWHWMCHRHGASWNERSPWYPSARVFRQHEFNRPHYWDEVVADVADALCDGQGW